MVLFIKTTVRGTRHAGGGALPAAPATSNTRFTNVSSRAMPIMSCLSFPAPERAVVSEYTRSEKAK
jgi:hypothetical protein